MPRRALRRALTAAATAVSALAIGLAAPSAHAATPLPYVALGDSYSAGSGVLPADLSAPLLCLRSELNYPGVVAERTGAALTDVTCGAAQTKHFTQAQYPGVAAQLDAVKSDTRLITLTIGGNDNNTFIGAMLACGTAGIATVGLGHPCKTLYGSTFDDQIDAHTYPDVKAALQKIRAKAPNARVAVLGYPWIMPATADSSCFVKMPIASGDVPYLRALQGHLNAVIGRAARETGATFVDFSKTSEGHDACAPSGTRWIEPLLFGTNVVPVHPNARGERAMAEQTVSALGLG
ncbi:MULTISPECIES: SGNH/GDSL hydrolase family protein [unclassified Streptomyces]|uniref:SGNH/GDSL hydrolase family protein n=1 Tax=unclassified Streptomyces TaxID=2593676 RepID=UPI0029B642A5|nr:MULTISPECIES: SGNH/GDSL hydrolase family protein [unclassified Streptomyces]MDX3088760.1 SGNH/GDSL hydrolase family protein [Streptomyces sp. ME12-02E]MDX3332110.1 SGNH/GDSL hydrolase family protein [Streptomyces sp. ME02-6978a]MDX3361380.1 SGNH/GDSL hydrolase family protein [Streptomyces sp. ME02-6978.2a]